MEHFPYSYLKNFRYYCQKVLPLVYDDSLSYYEVLCQVTDKLNELIDIVKKYDGVDYDTMVKYIESELDNLEEKLKEYSKNYTDTEIDRYYSAVLTIINALDSKITSEDQKLKSWMLIQFDNFYKYVASIKYNPIVINPVNGKMDSLQNTLNSLYYNFAVWSLRCIEYEELKLTCKDYEELKLTCSRYNLNGKQIIWGPRWIKQFTYMTNPIYGSHDDVRKVVNDMWVYFTNEGSITCEGYNNLGLSCQQYADMSISCIDYALKSKFIFATM